MGSGVKMLCCVHLCDRLQELPQAWETPGGSWSEFFTASALSVSDADVFEHRSRAGAAICVFSLQSVLLTFHSFTNSLCQSCEFAGEVCHKMFL